MSTRVRSDVHLLQEVANEIESADTFTKSYTRESNSSTADTASSSGRTSEVNTGSKKLIKIND